MDFVLNKALEDKEHTFVEILKATSVKILQQKINKQKGLIIVEGGLDEINRFCVESKKVDILLSPEHGALKDHMKSRHSGLNQVLCALAVKNNVAIGINFHDLLVSEHKALLLARIMQNVKLCKKYNVSMVLCSFATDLLELRSKDMLLSFGKVLGMSGTQAYDSLNFKKKII